MAEQESKYLTIISWIEQKIKSGELNPGDKILSENELSAMFGVSRQTARHAITELVEKGTLERIHGSGTYVKKTKTVKRTKKLNNIGVVCTLSESYIAPPTLKGIESTLFNNGYSMQMFFTDNKISREREILESILEKDVIDGLIFEPTTSALPSPNLPLYRKIQSLGIPLICYNAFYPGLEVPCVRINDRLVAFRAVKELVSRGHTKIAGIFKSDDNQGHLRYKGYIDALIESGIEVDLNRISWFDTPMLYNIYNSEEFIFKRIGDSTAVVCFNDQIAYALIDLALKRGIRIPEELSVTGVDDSYLAGISSVKITSFSHPKEVLGIKVAENMVRLLDDPDFDGNYLYDSEIILRESVR